MEKVVFVVLVLGVAAFGHPTEISRCRSNAPLPHYAQVQDCVTPPCRLPQLSEAKMRSIFSVSHDTDSLTALARAYIGIIPINYPLGDQSNVCNNENVNCPASAGTTVDFSFGLYIEPFFPVGTSVNVEFSVVDSSSRTLFCMRVPITIVSPVAAAIAPVEEVQVQHQIEENTLV